MKEKLLQLKGKIMQNKKKTAAIGIAALLLIGAGGYGIAASINNSDGESAKVVKSESEENQADKKVVKTDTEDEKSEKADADKEKDEKKSSSDKKETKKNEPVKKDEKKQDAKNSGTKNVSTDQVSGSTEKAKPSGNSTSGAGTVKTENNTQPSVPAQKQEAAPAPQPSAPDSEPAPAPQPQPESKPESNSKPEPPAHVHDYSIPITTQQWVVDQPAWTETVNEPVYDMVEIAVGNQSGIVITGDPNEYLLNNTNGDTGWHSEWIQQQTGTNTYTVDHPEQGHYETVTTGYKCSCGAAQ